MSSPAESGASPKARLLIVDDDPSTLASLARAFRLAGHEAVVCDSAARALDILRHDNFDLIFSDVVMPAKDGLAFLEEFRAAGGTTPVVMISGQAHISMAVKATRLGALDFLEKPVSTDKLLLTVDNVLRLRRLEEENRQLRQRLGKHEIVWRGESMRRILAQVDRVAGSETRVCIFGETGTGKELIARAVHDRSARRNGPFVTLNCAAVPHELVESELFGHEKGSFTGAASRHTGKFEQAQRGTLFLDEIGDMPLDMQAKLLRVLEQNEIERIGGGKPVAVDVRVVVATHRRLESLVQQGKFRQDLYHRIYVFPIVLPPLRERRDDIAALVEHFAAQVAAQNGWKPATFTADAMRRLEQYSWPGNVRELRNIVERLLLLASDGNISAELVAGVLPQTGAMLAAPAAGTAPMSGTLSERVAATERDAILSELNRNHFHISNTAKSLGLERSHLYKKCQQLGINLRTLRQERGLQRSKVFSPVRIFGRRPARSEERLQHLSATSSEHTARNFHLVIESRVVQHVDDRSRRSGFRIVDSVHQPAQTRVDHRAGTHRAGFDGAVERGLEQAMIARPPARFAHGHNFSVRRGIGIQQIAIGAAPDRASVQHDDRAHRNFARGLGLHGFGDGFLHPALVGIGVQRHRVLGLLF
jgi:two-component system, NtrC family, nitrogen regulation response regulator NtrX